MLAQRRLFTAVCAAPVPKTEVMMERSQENTALLRDMTRRLGRLSPDRLRVADDFVAYLAEREESEATEELLRLPGLEAAFLRAAQQVEAGEVVPFEDIRRDV